jgi:glycosyltransferase involved in cell wall biosynthesis
MFSLASRLKRDLGFRAQVGSSAALLLSSQDAERDCLNYYPEARGRTHVARFAVAIDGWPDVDAAWARLRSAGIPEDFVFLPNQLWQHKNHELAIEAAGLLAEQGSRRVILATGYGEDPRRRGYRAELLARIAELGAGNNIALLGSVDHGLVKAMMICANALLNPSHFEGWSTTVEEAKAAGTPMLLSDLPVHREQAPEARFFGVEDPIALANAIASAAPRSLDQVRKAVSEAKESNLVRLREFADVMSEIVRETAQASAKRMVA